jgi:hypothetical protein
MQIDSLEYAYDECVPEEHKKMLFHYLSGKIEDLVFTCHTVEAINFIPKDNGCWEKSEIPPSLPYPRVYILLHTTFTLLTIRLSFAWEPTQWDLAKKEEERLDAARRSQGDERGLIHTTHDTYSFSDMQNMATTAGKQIHAFREKLRNRFVESACGPGGLAFYVFETNDNKMKINTLLALYKNHWTLMTLKLGTESSFKMKIQRYTYAKNKDQMMQNKELRGCQSIDYILSVMDTTTFSEKFAGVRWNCIGGLCKRLLLRPRQFAFALSAKDANKDTKPSRTRPEMPVDVIDRVLQNSGELVLPYTEDIIDIMDSYDIESGLPSQDVHVSSSFTPSPYCFCASCGKLIG